MIQAITAHGERVASCHRSSPRWLMTVMARIPAETAPKKAPTAETLGATMGWNLRRARATVTQAPRPIAIIAPQTTRNTSGVIEPSALPETPK